MMSEIGCLGDCPRKSFEMVSSEASENTLLQGEMNAVVFIVRNHTEKEKCPLHSL